jgi:DNA-3-methyladenine glycosylase II
MTLQDTIPLLIEIDPLFRKILDEYGTPGFPDRPEGFESMCKTILEQQVSLDSARASFNRLKNFVTDFSPKKIAAATDEEIRACGITRQKTVYLKALAEAVLSGEVNFDSFRHKEPDVVRRELIQVKGIGNWTIDVYLMFSLQSPDILPLGDIGIISAMRDLIGIEDVGEMAKYAEKWSPYRTTAAFFLWHYYLEKRGRKFPH